MVSLTAVVAFSGFPGITPDEGATPRAMLAAASGEPDATDGVGGDPVTLALPEVPAAPPAPAPSRSTPAAPAPSPPAPRPDFVPAPQPVTPAPAVSAGGRAPAAPPARVSPPPAAPAPPSPGPAARAPVTEPLRDLGEATGEAGQAVEGVVGGADKAAGPISPSIAEAVQETGTTAGDTAPAPTEAVNERLDGLVGGGR